MCKWSKKIRKVLTAAAISAVVAVSSLSVPIAALAARTVTDDVMIRNDASTDAGIIGSLNEGDEVVILDVLQSGDGYAWYYIQLENGATGYVRSDLIEADDSELAAFRTDEQEEPAQEEEAEPEEAEPEEPAAEEETAPAEETAPEEETASPQTETEAQSTAAEGYDATKDPNANFRTGYEEEADGTVTWYVYNDDNGSKVKISDLQGQQNAPASVSGVAKIWKTLAILFGILAVFLAAFVLFLIRSIRDGRSKTTRGRALEAKAASGEFEDEEDEFDFDEDEDSEDEYEGEEPAVFDGEESAETDGDQARTPDSTIAINVPDETAPTEIPEEEIQDVIDAESENEETASGEVNSEPEEKQETEKEITEEPAAETDDETEAEAAENNREEAVQGEFAGEFEDEEGYVEEDYDEEDYVEEDYEDSESEETEEEFEDEEYEEEDYDDDEEESESRSSGKSSFKGGFFGFLKKVFGSESEEDAEEEGEDFDDYEEESEEHEFDEFKEYPEDVDLLPREDEDDGEYLEEDEDYEDSESEEEDSGRGRLSMQRVMKNVGYKEEEADFSQDDDYDSSVFEDDDMEYSFISNRKK